MLRMGLEGLVGTIQVVMGLSSDSYLKEGRPYGYPRVTPPVTLKSGRPKGTRE